MKTMSEAIEEIERPETATPKRPRGRPVGTTRGRMTRVQVKLPVELFASAKADAARHGVTFSEYVRESLRYTLAAAAPTISGK